MNEHVNDLAPVMEIKETITTTGYVDKDGKFVALDKLNASDEVVYVQDEEDQIQ